MTSSVRTVAWSLLLLVAALWFAPACPAAEQGSIRGTVRPARPGATVLAVDREAEKKYPGRVDPKTGAFQVDGLPLDRGYDLILDAGGARLEGVNLTVPHSDYEEEQPLTKEDVAKLKELTASLNQFENKVDVLAVRGNIQHAAVLVNKLRTQAFINSNAGEMIWRLELWHFERPDETWIKVQDELFVVLYRERLPKSQFDKKSLTLDPSLGGLRPTAKQPVVDAKQVALPEPKPGIRLRGEGASK